MKGEALLAISLFAGAMAWAVVLGLRLNPVLDISGLQNAPSSVPIARRPNPEDAAGLYALNCAACHGEEGAGRYPVFPPLAGSDRVVGNPDALISTVLAGASEPMTVNGIEFNGYMPAFSGRLSDRELAQVLTHIRSSWGNQAGEITPDDISRLEFHGVDRNKRVEAASAATR